jgi:hypothetical protein
MDKFVVCTDAIVDDGVVVGVELAAQIATALVRGVDDLGPLVHGDLAPWNLLRVGTETVVIDWESARPTVAPLFDLTHFVVRSGAFLGWHSPGQAARLLTKQSGVGWRHLCDVGMDPAEGAQFVYQYLDQTDGDVRDGRERRFRAGLRSALTGARAA